jgi:hypothetical protein
MVGIELQALLGLGKRLLSGSDFCLHPGALLTEGIGRHVVALLSVESDKTGLLGCELGD